MVVGEGVFVPPVFLQEYIEEARKDGNEFLLSMELYAVFVLGVLDKWVSKRKLARLLSELARRDLRVRRSIQLAEIEYYDNFLDVVSAPFYLDKAFEYEEGRVRLSDFGEVIFNEFMNTMQVERFFELKRKVLEIWKECDGRGNILKALGVKE